MIRKNIQQGGITQLDVDAIVSADNEHLDGSKIAKELKAYILFENGKIKDSQNILQNLLAKPDLSQISKDRITSILKTFENS